MGTLTAATPTPFTTDSLRTQLENIGLNCSELTDENLSAYIDRVKEQLPSGNVKVFAIQQPRSNSSSVQSANDLEDSAQGNWTLDNDAQGYYQELAIMQVEERWNWLYDDRENNGFQGIKDDPPEYTGYYDNAEAIQDLFVNAALSASSTVVEGIDQQALEAMLTNVIAPLTDENISDYDDTSSRVIFLVFDYDPDTGYSEGVGSVTVEWHLRIEDYLRKDKDGGDTHDTLLKVWSRSLLYYSPEDLCRHYDAVVQQFNLTEAPPCSYTRRGNRKLKSK